MMFRAVARVFLPLALAVTLCIHGTAQTPDAPQTKGAAPAKGTSVFSSSLNANSNNDLASIYGTPVVQIVARVNDRVITNSDITRAQTQLDQDAHQNNWTLEQYNRNEKNLLRDLIDQQLLLSKGKQLGITGDTELIKRLDEIRKQNHLESLEDLEKAVEQQGISYEDFKANIRHSIITQQVVRDEVGSKMQISQAEIEKYYNEHKDSYTQPESVHLNEILIPTSDNATSSELAAADAKAKDIEAKLKAGASFTDMAKKYSGGPTAPQGGDLGQFRRGALAKVLEDQTFNLPVGGYTAPIRTKQGYIILQTTEHTPGGLAPLQKVEPEIEQAIYMQKIQPAVRAYLTRLRDEAYIDIRTGYVDSAASANESKPTYAAYAPPQPKKKKKKKNRFDQRDVRFARPKPGKAAQPVMASAVAPTAVGAAGESVTTSAATATHSRFKRSHAKKQMARKSKREKFRFGRAPNTRVSDEQVATTASSNAQQTPSTDAAAAQTNAVSDTAAGSDVQPLGPDLEHNPTITQPVQQKRRFSDEARNKAQMEARKNAKKNAKKNHKKLKKAKKLKKDNAKATPLTPAELAAQKVQSAPLGLEGATATKKKKKKKVRVKNGEKTRLSDQKKSSQKNGSSKKGSSVDTSSSQKPTSNGNGDTTTPTPPAASAPTNQPQ